jgi:hypothetical protein
MFARFKSKYPTRVRRTFVLASALFAGCSGAGSQFSLTEASAGHASKTWQQTQPIAAFHTDATAGTLYASSPTADTVTEYMLPGGGVLGTLGASSGIDDVPQGMFFSKDHLYVTNGNQVLVFPAGQTMPSEILQDSGSVSGPYVNDVVVGNDGSVYLANVFQNYSGAGVVAVFKKGQTIPSYVIRLSESEALFSVTLDSSNNLYLAYDDLKGLGRIDEYAPGKQKGKNTGWSLKYANPGGMAFDRSGNLVIVDDTVIDVFSKGIQKPIRAFGSLKQGAFLAFNKTQTHLFVTDSGSGQIDEFDYTTGGVVKTISLADATGVAIDPPASL